jgi:hypothetical protein
MRKNELLWVNKMEDGYRAMYEDNGLIKMLWVDSTDEPEAIA